MRLGFLGHPAPAHRARLCGDRAEARATKRLARWAGLALNDPMQNSNWHPLTKIGYQGRGWDEGFEISGVNGRLILQTPVWDDRRSVRRVCRPAAAIAQRISRQPDADAGAVGRPRRGAIDVAVCRQPGLRKKFVIGP